MLPSCAVMPINVDFGIVNRICLHNGKETEQKTNIGFIQSKRCLAAKSRIV